MASSIADIVTRSVVKPLGFLVAHPMYYGPVFLLFLFCWKPFSQIIRTYGLGLTLVIWMGVFTSITPESRQSLPSYIMAIPILGLTFEKLALPRWFLWLTGALALASSKVWVSIDLPAYDDGQYLQFPLQRFFMNQGPWMNNHMYVLQGMIVLAAVALLHVYFRKHGTAVDLERLVATTADLTKASVAIV